MEYDHSFDMLEEISVISQRIERFENQLNILINGQHSIIGLLSRALKKRKRHSGRKTKEMKFIQQKDKPLTPSDVSKLVHLPEALQRNISKFTQNILFTSSNIQDDLVSMQCLSEDECTDITSKTNPKDQVRLLIRKIKSRGPDSINSFLKAVEKDKPELVTEVYNTLDEIVNENKDNPVCAICIMKNTVNLKDIVDSLWEEKIISDDIFQDIIDSNSLHQSRPLIWSSVMVALNDLTDQGKAKEILINALKPKYEHIVGYINQSPERPSLNCWCCTRCLRLPQRSLSQTDHSRSPSRIPTFLYNGDVFEEYISSPDGLQSNDLLSYENPDDFCHIQSSAQVVNTKRKSYSPNIVAGSVNCEKSISEGNIDDELSLSKSKKPIEKKESIHSSNKTTEEFTLSSVLYTRDQTTSSIETNSKLQNNCQSKMILENNKNDGNHNDLSKQANISLSQRVSAKENQTENTDQNMDECKTFVDSKDIGMEDRFTIDIDNINEEQNMDNSASKDIVYYRDKSIDIGETGDNANTCTRDEFVGTDIANDRVIINDKCTDKDIDNNSYHGETAVNTDCNVGDFRVTDITDSADQCIENDMAKCDVKLNNGIADNKDKGNANVTKNVECRIDGSSDVAIVENIADSVVEDSVVNVMVGSVSHGSDVDVPVDIVCIKNEGSNVAAGISIADSLNEESDAVVGKYMAGSVDEDNSVGESKDIVDSVDHSAMSHDDKTELSPQEGCTPSSEQMKKERNRRKRERKKQLKRQLKYNT